MSLEYRNFVGHVARLALADPMSRVSAFVGVAGMLLRVHLEDSYLTHIIGRVVFRREHRLNGGFILVASSNILCLSRTDNGITLYRSYETPNHKCARSEPIKEAQTQIKKSRGA